MPNVEENAFQIARYLLENHQEDGQVTIRDALRLTPEDFSFALKLLVDGGCCSTYGQPQAKEAGIKRNVAKLHEFVNHINEMRIQLSGNAERLLKYLYDEQVDFPFSLWDHTAAEFGWSESQYIQTAQELDDNDFVSGEYASGNPFFKISILPPGRKIVRNNFRSEKNSQSTVVIDGTIAINDNKGIININSTLTSVYQSVEDNLFIDSSSKQEIENLLQQLESALIEVPGEKIDGAEAVAEMAKSLIENATKEKPNKKLIEISAEGLKKAAKDLAIIIPSVLLISEKLISFILALHR